MNRHFDDWSRRQLLARGGGFALSATAMAGFLAACGGDDNDGASSEGAPAASNTGEPKKGGKLTVGIGQTFEDINALTAAGYRWGQLIAFAIYDTLVKFDDKGEAIPLLAESWTLDNPRTTTVKLRQGVKFHDGSPLRVEDVVWTLNRIHDPKRPVSTNFLALPASVWGKAEKVDDQTFKITTKKPARMVESWRFWFILPENADDKDLGTNPNGTGPFRVTEFVKGDRLDLEANRDYWDTGKPYLDNLTFRFLKDQSVQIASFLSGDVDYLHDLPVSEVAQVEGKNDSVLIRSGTYFEWWQPQMYSGPLADPKVRQALMWAFDKETVNNVAYGGKGKPTWNPFELTPYDAGITVEATYDPERAKSLLAEAGQPNLKLNMLTITDPGAWNRESQVLQQGFKAAGIDATLQSEPGTKWYDILYTKRNHEGIAVNAGTLPFPFALIANYMMQATLPPIPPEYPDPAEPDLFAAYEEAFASTEEAGYAAALKKVQELMLGQAAVFHTVTAQNQNVAPKNLQGMESTLFGDQRFTNAFLA